MKISVASGKGGTGKTLVATCLSAFAGDALLVDCDVEEPNAHLFFPQARTIEEDVCQVSVPQIEESRCNRCGECSRFCAYNALAVFPGDVLVFPELCHGCGGCALVCPQKAISEAKRPVGAVRRARAGEVELLWGELFPGEPMASPLIKEVKRRAEGRLVLIDCPPGTSCQAIAAVDGSDFCLLVAEPTPFGLYDLDLAVMVLDQMSIDCGVVVNKWGIGDDALTRYCRESDIPILMEIPWSQKIAGLYSRGLIFAGEMPEWQDRFRSLLSTIQEMVD
ncbi:MAG: (4Fe-4S)-binding protein [Methanosarcinales archaeon]|nr:(4Fe-4S)-binding protein [Methanosarcinales archaeon]